jgi:hypothetical protein
MFAVEGTLSVLYDKVLKFKILRIVAIAAYNECVNASANVLPIKAV